MDYVSQHASMPREIKSEKEKMPVAYLGLGILEWHGEHNVAGLDGVKAEGLAAHFARKFGGVVMPPQFWGDDRDDICELVLKTDLFPEAGFDHTIPICEKMGYDIGKLQRNAERSRRSGGWRLWIELINHMFFEIESFGYRCIVPIPGHYPLFRPLATAIEKYGKDGGTCDIFTLKDSMFDDTGNAGDHAAMFETSLMMALFPDKVDLTRLDGDLSKPNIGVLGEDPRVYASVEFGRQIIGKFDTILENHFKELGLLQL
jgi:creatinine amidohydrolase